MGERPGAILSFETFLYFINRLLVTIQHPAKDWQRGTLSAPSWCLCQKLSLSLLYFSKTLLHKSSEWSSLVTGPGLHSSPPEAKNPGIFHSSTKTFHSLVEENIKYTVKIMNNIVKIVINKGYWVCDRIQVDEKLYTWYFIIPSKLIFWYTLNFKLWATRNWWNYF